MPTRVNTTENVNAAPPVDDRSESTKDERDARGLSAVAPEIDITEGETGDKRGLYEVFIVDHERGTLVWDRRFVTDSMDTAKALAFAGSGVLHADEKDDDYTVIVKLIGRVPDQSKPQQ